MKNRLLIIIAAVSMCIPGIIFGQTPPPLGTVSQFVIFSSNGALTHTGAGINSHITGDIGSEIGGNSGFGNVDGTMRAGDGVTATALADLNVMYLNLSTQGPLTAHVPLLGGETLPPGLYEIPVPATPSLNGVLTLDGGGNPNAYFFFKLGTDFSTGPASEVKLINGAKACNVFWLVEGTVDIAVGTQMRGNIIANNAAINIATGVTLEGRALSTAGAISVNTGLIATKPIGCGSPVLTGPLAPNLASTSCYAIFSSAGPVTDDGNSILTGDVGTNLGSTLGYDPLKVAGAIHAGPDGSTAACATDVGPAYNYLNLLPNDIELLYPADFGYGLVLTPHIYIMNAAVTSFVDTLFLNAEGNPNAVFVIKVNGAFSTGTYSQVVLQNGAQAKNVFWKIDGATTINDYSVFKGTIISAGAIILKTGVEIEGRVLTSVGAIDTYSTQVNVPAGTCGLSCIPASITTGPTDQTVCEGDSIGFSVTATGDGLTYQWRKGNVDLIDGGAISGATTDTLSIDPTGLSDGALDYNVIVSGACGNDTSIFVSLTISPATVITLEPIDQTVCIGDSAGFTVTATGGNLTYQWRIGNVDLIDGGNISGATTDSLSINPVSTLDTAYNYNVIVTGTGTCGIDTSINVSLMVDSTAVIVVQPIDKTVCEGDSVYFSVVATGANLTYQWRKGTVDLVNGGNISGATSDTLVINPANIADVATDYNVVVTGGCSPVGSTSVNLNSAGDFGILAATAITSTGATVITNYDVGISPGVRSQISGFPPATLVNGAIYASDDIAPAGVAAMLTQAKLDLKNAYLIAEGATMPAPVTVSGDQGGVTLPPGIYKSTSTLLIQSGDLTLDAQGDPNASWIFQIASDFTTIGGAGGNVILAGGAQAKNITWQVGSSATIGNGTSFKGNILALTSITMNTGSSIEGRLLARNGAVVLSGANVLNLPSNSTPPGFSNLTSVDVSLIVTPATVITLEPTNQMACLGDSIGFTVTASGDNLTYQWRKGNVDLIDGGAISGATTDILSINPTDASDEVLNYNVIVSGTCGNDTSIFVSFATSPVTAITLEPINQTVCSGDSVGFTVTATGGNLTYQWRKGNVDLIDGGAISGSTTDTLSIDPVSASDTALNYNVIVSGACKSDTSIFVSLTVNPTPIAIVLGNPSVCSGDSINLMATTVSGGSYEWTCTTGYASSTQNASIPICTITDAGTYSLIITANGCSSLPSSTTVDVNDCGTDLSVVKTVNNTQPSVGNTVVFTIVVTNNSVADATGVGVNDLLQSGYTYVSSTVTTGTFNPTTGVWTIDSLANGSSATMTVTVTVNATGNYVNTATVYGNEVDGDMANNSSTTETFPTDFFIPEGFSPNDDGINDLFVIRGISNYPKNEFTIYNRWGNKVYEASSYQSTWSGNCTTGLTVGGDELPTGTYFYTLDLKDGSDVFKGTIYLNR